MSITSTSGTQQVTQSAWQQLQLQQARQFAERAAQNASQLQARASDAQAQADRARENARAQQVAADQAQGVAVQAQGSVRATEATGQIGPQISSVAAEAVQTQQSVQAQVQPTVNTQGETIGTVVNVTA